MDFKVLNDIIARPVRRFPPLSWVVLVELNIQIFCLMDLAHGYHQITLNKKTNEHATFIVPMDKGGTSSTT